MLDKTAQKPSHWPEDLKSLLNSYLCIPFLMSALYINYLSVYVCVYVFYIEGHSINKVKNEQGLLTIVSELNSHRVPYTFDLVSNYAKHSS